MTIRYLLAAAVWTLLATPGSVRTFRVPSALQPIVEESDRFHLKPLIRAITFPNACFVLALAEGAVRLTEVSADLPAAPVKIDGMPKDAGSADGAPRSTSSRRAAASRVPRAKRLLRQFAQLGIADRCPARGRTGAVLDGLYRDEIAHRKTLFAARNDQDRPTTDVAGATAAASAAGCRCP